MLEKDIENLLVWHVERIGGKAYKFCSPSNRGVSDRIVCLPDGTTWFIELKKKGGRLSVQQQLFAGDMLLLNQKYACLWNAEEVEKWAKSL
jgi:hypothetical protein